MTKVIKIQNKQYWGMKEFFNRSFGNISFSKGLYILMYNYVYMTSRGNKIKLRRMFYNSNKNRSNLRGTN